MSDATGPSSLWVHTPPSFGLNLDIGVPENILSDAKLSLKKDPADVALNRLTIDGMEIIN